MTDFDRDEADRRLSRDDREDAEARLLFLDRFDTPVMSERPAVDPPVGAGRSLTTAPTDREGETT